MSLDIAIERSSYQGGGGYQSVKLARWVTFAQFHLLEFKIFKFFSVVIPGIFSKYMIHIFI